jgi:hypothetical protein
MTQPIAGVRIYRKREFDADIFEATKVALQPKYPLMHQNRKVLVRNI